MMEYLNVMIELHDVVLTVLGNYWPEEASTHEEPGQPEFVEIDSIMTKEGSDISSLIAASTLMHEVEQQALAKHKANAAELHFDAMIDALIERAS